MSRNSECDFVCAPISSLARGIPHATCSCTVVLRNVALSPSTRLSRSATIPAPVGHSAKLAAAARPPRAFTPPLSRRSALP